MIMEINLTSFFVVTRIIVITMKLKLADFYTPQPAKQQNTNTETAELSLLRYGTPIR